MSHLNARTDSRVSSVFREGLAHTSTEGDLILIAENVAVLAGPRLSWPQRASPYARARWGELGSRGHEPKGPTIGPDTHDPLAPGCDDTHERAQHQLATTPTAYGGTGSSDEVAI